MAETFRNGDSQKLLSLPYFSEDGEVIDERDSLRIRAILARINPNALSLVDIQIDAVEEEVLAELGGDAGKVTLTKAELRAVIARAAIRGGTQALVSTAETLEVGRIMSEHYSTEHPEVA